MLIVCGRSGVHSLNLSHIPRIGCQSKDSRFMQNILCIIIYNVIINIIDRLLTEY